MLGRSRMRHVICRSIAAFTTACLAVLAALPAAADVAWPTRVVAIYKVKLAGVEFGTFNFSSSINGEQYSLAGDAKLTWGMGLFNWIGTVRGAGTLGSAPLPGSYTYEYKGHDKGGSIALGFRDHDVVSLKVEPPNTPSPEHIPLTPQHLKDVFDPLSALLAVGHGSIGTPCGRRVPIFDGKQRFDLVLSFRRQEKIPEPKPSGEPNVGFVCRVQYIPIAGHRDNAATRAFAANEGIEVKLRPVPSANVLVPYQIVIPTAVGSAVLQSTRVEITTPGDRHIAFTF